MVCFGDIASAVGSVEAGLPSLVLRWEGCGMEESGHEETANWQRSCYNHQQDPPPQARRKTITPGFVNLMPVLPGPPFQIAYSTQCLFHWSLRMPFGRCPRHDLNTVSLGCVVSSRRVLASRWAGRAKGLQVASRSPAEAKLDRQTIPLTNKPGKSSQHVLILRSRRH